MGNKKVVNSSVADRSSYNIHVIHDKKPATLDDLIEAENGKPVLVMYAYQHDLTRIQQRFGKDDPENVHGFTFQQEGLSDGSAHDEYLHFKEIRAAGLFRWRVSVPVRSHRQAGRMFSG